MKAFFLLTIAIVFFSTVVGAQSPADDHDVLILDAAVHDAGFDGDVGDAAVPVPPAAKPPAVDTGKEISSIFGWLYDAAKSGDLFWIVTALLSALTWILNTVFKVTSKHWKRVVLLLTAVIASLGVSQGAGEAFTWKVVLVALAHAVGAAFAWDVPRDLRAKPKPST